MFFRAKIRKKKLQLKTDREHRRLVNAMNAFLRVCVYNYIMCLDVYLHCVFNGLGYYPWSLTLSWLDLVE